MKLAEAYVEVKTNQAKFGRELKTMESSVKRSTDRMKKNFDRIGRGVSEISRVARYAFLGMAAAIAGTVYAAAKFEKQMANVSTMLSQKSMPIMKKYKDLVGKMAVTFGESTKTLSKGLYDILSASIKPEKALKVLAVSAKAAAAGITDTGVAADAITTIMNSYGYAAEDAGKISDKLFTIIKAGKTTFAELGPNIGKVAATAAMAGLSFDELGATIATVTKAGIRTEMAMTAINGILKVFIKPSDEAREAAREFGLELDSNTLKTIGLVGVMEKLKGISAERLAQIFPEIEGLKGVAAALGDLTGYTEVYKEMLESAGATQEAYDKQTATLTFAFNQLKEAGKYLAVQIGEIFTPIVLEQVKKLMNFVANLASAMKSLTIEQKKTIAKMVLLGTAALGAIGALGLFAKLAVLVKAAGLIIMGTLGLITSPLGLIMVALAALVAVWAIGWDKIKDKILEVWEKIRKLDWESIFEVHIKPKLVWIGKKIDDFADWCRKEMGLPEDPNKAFDLGDIIIIARFVGDLVWEGMKAAGKAIDNLVLWIQKEMGIPEEARKGIWELTEIMTVIPFLAELLWKGIKNVAGTIKDWVMKMAKLDKPIDELITKVTDFVIELPDPAKWMFRISGRIFEYTTLGYGIWWALSGIIRKIKIPPLAPLKVALQIVLVIGTALIAFDIGKWLTEHIKPLNDWVQREVDKFQKEHPLLWGQFVEMGPISVPGIKAIGLYIAQIVIDGIAEGLKLITIDGKAPGVYIMDRIAETLPAVGEYAKIGIKIAGDILLSIVKGFKAIGLGIWDILVTFWTEGIGPAVDKIKDNVSAAFKRIEEIKIDWDLWPEAEARTRNVIDNIDRVAKTVEKQIGKKIPRDIQLMSIALIASESSFNRNEKAVDRLGRVYKGLGQHGEAAIEELKKMGLVIDDINDPAQSTAATMAYFSKILEENNGDIAKSILIYKGWGKELVKAGGNIDKLPKEAKKQLNIYIKLLNEFAGDSYKIMTKAGKIMVYGKSPGGIVGELKAGQKDLDKQLDRMLDSMDAMTKKMMVVFQPIIGLFKKMFEGIVETMIKSENKAISQMGKDLKSFVDGIIAMMEGMFDTIEKGLDSTVDKAKASWKEFGDLYNRTTDGMKTGWQKFCETVKKLFKGMEDDWKSFTASVKTAFKDAVVSVLTGTKSIGDALFDMIKSVGQALANLAVAAAATGNYIAAVFLAAASVVIGAIKKTTTHFETAWGTVGRNFAHTTMEMGENIRGFCDMLETEFNRVGLAISKTIEDAQYKLEGLYQSQIDLQKSTREKLIDELDKYYDYRTLRDMSLTELLNLSAETRGKIERGEIAETEASEAEKAAKDKDRAMSRLEMIEEGYRKESELIRRKIALTQIEIKFLELKIEREEHHHSARAKQLEDELDQMLKAYNESVDAYEDAERRKQAATDETRETVEEANEEMRDSTEVAAEAMEDAMRGTAEAIEDAAEDMADAIEEATRDMVTAIQNMTTDIVNAIKTMATDICNAIDAMVDAINTKLEEIPERIEFDVVGILHMPNIPSIGTQYFNIEGIPSAQIGIPYIPRTMPIVVHREEAILNPPQAREWRAGGGGKEGTQVIYERGAIRMTVMGNISQQVDLEEAMDYLAQKQTERLRRL